MLDSVPTLLDQFFDSNGARIRYVDHGAGEPVLLVHGYTRSIETNWVEPGVFLDLARDHRVIAFDLRGHGKSDKPHDPGAYREMAADAIRLLDHLGIQKAHVVGYSLGAAIVARLVAMNPQRFLTATLGAGLPLRNWTPESDQRAEATATELQGEVPFRSLVLLMAPPDEPKPTEDDIRRRSQALAAVSDVMALAAFNRGGRQPLLTSAEVLRATSVPILGVVGSLDGALGGMKQFQSTLPGMDLVVVDGATHGGVRAVPRRPEFVNAIREFIAAHRSAPTR